MSEAGKLGDVEKIPLAAIFVTMTLLLLGASPFCAARAEILQQKYGSDWDCNSISIGPDHPDGNELYAACKPCMDADEDFDQTGPRTGVCVARPGGGGAALPHNPSLGGAGDPGRVGSPEWNERTCNDSIEKLKSKLSAGECGDPSDLGCTFVFADLAVSCPYTGRSNTVSWAKEAMHEQVRSLKEAARKKDATNLENCRNELKSIVDQWKNASSLKQKRDLVRKLSADMGSGGLVDDSICAHWRKDDELGDWMSKTRNSFEFAISKQQKAEAQAGSQLANRADDIANTDVFGKDARKGNACRTTGTVADCVSLDQTGAREYWHLSKLVNTCNQRFNVNVFSCAMEWDGGCSTTSYSIGPCLTDGLESWKQNAEIR